MTTLRLQRTSRWSSWRGARVGFSTLLVLLASLALLSQPVQSQALSDDEDWDLFEDLSDSPETGGEVPGRVRELIDRNARQIVENLERSADSYIAALDHLKDLSFNESMRETQKDFGELFGEMLGELLLGNLAAPIPKLGITKITDLPSFIPVLEAWGGAVTGIGPRRGVGHWIIDQRDRWLRLRAGGLKTEELARDLVEEYRLLEEEGDREAFEVALDQGLLDAIDYQVPDHIAIEQSFWEQWTVAHFDSSAELGDESCEAVGGCVEIWLAAEDYLLRDADLTFVGAWVHAPGGDIVKAGLNRVLKDSQVGGRLLSLAVPKRICFGSYDDWENGGFRRAGLLSDLLGDESDSGSVCGWLGADNKTLVRPTLEAANEYFDNRTWRSAGGGGRFAFDGWP
ncbi:MAG: hypothetical protein K0U98_08425 [Deltaproteobacteria bacterium]|nr:hypothetical protein [Deltaproteobacteria bacterium]